MIQRKAEKWGVNDDLQIEIEKIKKEAYRELSAQQNTLKITSNEPSQ